MSRPGSLSNAGWQPLEGRDHGLHIDGAEHFTGRFVAVERKWPRAPLARVAEAGTAELELAIRGAERALGAPLTPWQRRGILIGAADRIEAWREELSRLLCRETGKTWKDVQVEISRAVQALLFSAEEARRISGEMVPVDALPGSEGRISFTIRTPVGIVAAITPFNYPFLLGVHKVGPALAAGNAVVLKPAPLTPLSSLVLARALQEAGLPPGYLQVLVGGPELGEAMLQDPRFGFYTFTGSTGVGRHIKESVGMRRVALELGNNSPNIVHRDADLPAAAQACARKGTSAAGQACISVQRILVHEAVFEEFVGLLGREMEALRVGDPEDPETDVGPMVSEDAARRAADWLAQAVAGGARVVAGGRVEAPFVHPTVLADTAPQMQVECQEVFAPIVTVRPYRTLDEAFAYANDTRFGLQAGIFTQSLDVAMAAARRLHFGGVIVNDASSYRADNMPYGGVKDSGIGREGPRYAIEDLTEVRTVVLNLGEIRE